MDIDHNPRETRETNAIWWIIWPILLASWACLAFFGKVEWVSAIGGLGTGCVLATWAIEITGNKVPDSWRPKPRRR